MPPFRFALPVALAAALVSAGCARQTSPNVVEGSTVGQVTETYPGVIESARVVSIQEGDRLQQNTTGGLIGGAAGAGAGAAVASTINEGWGKAIAIGAGAILGAAAGAVAERETTRQTAIEYVVRLDDGRLVTVVQGVDGQLAPGQRVFMQVARGGRARVVPAPPGV